MTRLLLIGPLPPPMGGDTRHFATLVADIGARENFSTVVVDTSRGQQHWSFARNLATALRTLMAVLRHGKDVDVVSFHASDRGMYRFGPLVVLLGRLIRVPVVLRLFGGSFGDFYAGGNAVTKAVVRRFILSADAVLLQTRRSISQLEPHATGKLVWFSTYIRRPAKPLGDVAGARDRCRRFVFLGHLWRTKGIEVILDAASRLPQDCGIDLFGPLDEYTAEEIERRGHGRVRYCGFLTHDQVDTTLWNYDCLLLPTHHPGEGYPGVIAEAFAHGLPVVATRWLAIPEIVDESCGILVEPRDTGAFVAALTTLHRDEALWRRLGQGARQRAEQFDHEVWSRKFEALCEALVKN